MNPPFSLKSWSNGLDNDYGRFEFGRPPAKNGDYAFLLHVSLSTKDHDYARLLGYGGDRSASIGLDNGQRGVIPFSELTWARPENKRSATVGAAPNGPQDVLKIGDVIYVEPIHTAGNYGLRQVPERVMAEAGK